MFSMKTIGSLVLFLGLQACSASSDPPDRAHAVGSFVESAMQQQRIPGLSVAVVRDGAVVVRASYGVSNIATGAQVSSSTPFQIASTTKPFTATAVLLLVADGRLSLDDRLGGLLEGLPETWRGVTVRQLLSHTSGLPDIVRSPGQLDLIGANWEEVLPLIEDAPLQFAPGQRWAYTQTNYVLLTKIIERTVGMPFEAFLQQRMFQPLGMNETFFASADPSARSCATNYEPGADGQQARPLVFPAFVHGAGGLCTSVDDLIRWNAALDSGRILPASLAEAMWSPITLADGSIARLGGGSVGYGLGWAVDTTPGRRAVGHSGGNSTAFRRFRDDKLTVIVLHNGVADPDALVASIASIMLRADGGPGAEARLWDAAIAGDSSAVEAALADGAEVDALDTRTSRNGRRALNWAAVHNHAAIIEVLIARGASIEAENATGFTALSHAAEAGSLEAARALIASGANPTHANRAGQTPAQIARANGHNAVAELIERAAAR